MANHSHVYTKTDLTFDQVHQQLCALIKEFWGEALEVEVVEQEPGTAKHIWWVQVKGVDPDSNPFRFPGFSVWFDGKNHLEFRHPPSRWAGWAQFKVMKGLAVAFKTKGKIDVGGIGKTGVSSKVLKETFREFCQGLYAHAEKDNPDLVRQYVQSDLDEAHPSVRDR